MPSGLLKTQPNYGEREIPNPYLNTPPTELRRMAEGEKDARKKRQMLEALAAWRLVVPGPFRGRLGVARRLLAVARELLE